LVLVIAGAHFIHDVFTAFLAPLLPLLIQKLGLSLVQAGSLAVFTQIPSVFNPFIGALADRGTFRRILIIIAPGLTGTLMCLMGLAPGYATLAVMLLMVGCSVAVLHVAAPPMVSQLVGGTIGRGMSFFTVAGELARTVGPLAAVQVVSAFGLDGMWRVFPVAVASSLLLWWRLGRVPEHRPATRPSGVFAVWLKMRRVLGSVLGVLLARVFMVGAITTFLPTFLYSRGLSLLMANVALSVFELAGAIGSFTSGTISDKLGRRRVLIATTALSPPFMVLFLYTTGPARMLALACLGFAALATTPVMLAVTIENSGSNTAAAIGTYMMVNFAARSVVVLAVGAMGDWIGLEATFLGCAGIAVLGVPFAFLLPRSTGPS
jgi:FSR family fosmidomycin resistance protein-like MFS transporter